MKKKMLNFVAVLLALYLIVCVLLYFFQEKLLFLPGKLPPTHVFSFQNKVAELSIQTPDNEVLNALLFKANNERGLVFYLHGNAGSLDSWGEVAATYMALNYDVFLLDYRGYGKSTGAIRNEQQLYDDVQAAYDVMKKQYPENKIIVLGYSIGSGPAAWLASQNDPAMLILQAPYYSMVDLVERKFQLIPSFLLRYKLPTHQYLASCRMPVIIFHGDRDEVIYHGSSEKLANEFKAGDQFITLKEQGHNGITDNPEYKSAIARLLP